MSKLFKTFLNILHNPDSFKLSFIESFRINDFILTVRLNKKCLQLHAHYGHFYVQPGF